MELNITRFFTEAPVRDYSASVAEIGADAGQITWANACDDAGDYDLLDTDEKREAFRAYVRGLGAWDDDEIAAWDDVELNALCMQFISGDIREFREWAGGDWEEWQARAQAGVLSGNMFRAGDGAIYYSMWV